ncbi:lipid A deacylase LpxR family protein [Sulfurimonas sp. CS5]|uniref:lipid A deacylase LpxR family protein n=1 Tax=Sulfurimonas sp. CS5 TaxID=3391145 RepID=UPI0039EB33B6
MKNITKLLFLAFASTLSADQVSFQFNNDFFAGTDRHYSNGFALSWIDDTYEHKVDSSISFYSRFMLGLFNVVNIHGLEKSKKYNTGVSISQAILTPEDVSLSTPQYDDSPYAAYLDLALFIFEWDDNSFNEYRLSVGVIGDYAGGEEIQNEFHSLIGNENAKGWDTQLKTQYSVEVMLQYGEISWEYNKKSSFSMDWFNHFGTNLGNFETSVFAGSMFRIGNNYSRSFNVQAPLLQQEASSLQLKKRNNDFGWSISTGVTGSLQAYSYLVEEARDEGYEMDKKVFYGSLYTGTDLFYQNHKVTLFYQTPTKYSTQENSRDIFGGFIYSYRF